MVKHYSLIELESYHHKLMSCSDKFRCGLHLLFCRRCRLRLRRLREDDELVAELRTALKAMSVPGNPAEYQRLCKLIDGKEIEK